MISINKVAVVGAGTMGRQISLQIARHGIPVTLYDIEPSALDEARAAQRAILSDWLADGSISAVQEAAIMGAISCEANLQAAMRGVDLAIEAVPERLDLKRAVFKQLDAVLPERAIIATNSSSIRVSRLEDATERPERVANLHFYLPVWESPMAEVGAAAARGMMCWRR